MEITYRERLLNKILIYKHIKYLLLTTVLFVFLLILSLFSSCAGKESKLLGSQVDLSKLELIEDNTLKVATSSGLFPFEDYENGNLEGIDIDIINMVADDLGLKLDLQCINFEDIIPQVKKHENYDVAIACISINDERRSQVSFTTPYYKDKKVLITSPNSNIDTKNIDDVINNPNTKLAVKAFTSAEEYVKQNYKNLQEVPCKYDLDCVNKLLANEVDIMCCQESLLDYWGRNQIKVVKEIQDYDEIAICLPKSSVNLYNAINKDIAMRISDGSIDKIVNEWFKD